MMTDLFPGFAPCPVTLADGSVIHGITAGAGPVVLLLHGFPQTHAAWHRIAPALAARYRVVALDLPGYGHSRIAPDGPLATAPSRRAIAADLAAAMTALGHDRFAVVGHDRGARAAYRMTLDLPERVVALASMTVEPTLDVWGRMTAQGALKAPHWFFFALPPEMLERLFAADPLAYLDQQLDAMAGTDGPYHPAALAAYRESFARASVRRAVFDDYRAAAGIDQVHEAADRAEGRRIRCPLLFFHGALAAGADPLATWRLWADDARAQALPGGHMQPEMAAVPALAALVPFLDAAFAR